MGDEPTPLEHLCKGGWNAEIETDAGLRGGFVVSHISRKTSEIWGTRHLLTGKSGECLRFCCKCGSECLLVKEIGFGAIDIGSDGFATLRG
jgi:hypothetical protein